MPVLMKAFDDYQMPENVTARMWENIAEGAGITAASGIAASMIAATASATGKVTATMIKAKLLTIGSILELAFLRLIKRNKLFLIQVLQIQNHIFA